MRNESSASARLPGAERLESAGDVSFEIGNRLLVEPGGAGMRLLARVVGMIPGRCLIFQLPPLLAEEVGVFDYLYEGNSIHVYFPDQASGDIKVFQEKIAGVARKPVRLLFVNYPVKAMKCNCREHKRVACHFPADVNYVGGKSRGLVTDISLGGCRLAFNADNDGVAGLERGSEMRIRFETGFVEGKADVLCSVRNVKSGNGNVQVGAMFKALSSESYHAVSAFLKEMNSYLG